MSDRSNGLLVLSDNIEGNTRNRLLLWAWVAPLLAAICLAFYLGFRLPSLYVSTLLNISVFDGALRRGLLGSLLKPLFAAAGYHYVVVALWAICILILVVGAAVVLFLNARWDSQRLLIIVWFMSPAGAYLFHQVGYSDQFIFLVFVLASWCIIKKRAVWAVVLLSVSVLVHELTLFTTLPVSVLLYVLVGGSLRRIGYFLIPVLVGGVLAISPTMSMSQSMSLKKSLDERLPFVVRQDAIELFTRGLSETWDLDFSSPWVGLAKVLPVALVAALSVGLVAFAMTQSLSGNRRKISIVLAVAAAVSPFTLVFFGWDFDRWIFLGLASCVVVCFCLMSSSSVPPSVAVVGASIAPLLLMFHIPLVHFDGFSPRPLSWESVRLVVVQPGEEMLRMPTDQWTP